MSANAVRLHAYAALLTIACPQAFVSSRGNDATALLQERLAQGLTHDAVADVQARRNVSDSLNDTNDSNSTPVPVEYSKLYRFNFTRTWGDDHICYTEIEFYDVVGKQLNVSYVSSTSCYGCAIDCDGCTVPYGNPHKQFDKAWQSAGENEWSCSDVGSFGSERDANGSRGGSTIVTFNITSSFRPASYKIRRPNLDGNAFAKDWLVQERRIDGAWRNIGRVTDAPKSTEQSGDLAADSGPAGRWWEWADPNCLLDYSGSGTVERVKLDYNYDNGRLFTIANNGRGIHLDSAFGSLNYNGAVYTGVQVHFVYSQRSEGMDNPAVVAPLEMRLVHQRQGSKDYDDIIVVVVPLRLPLESESQDTATEEELVKLGMTGLPLEGEQRMLPSPFNFSAFDAVLQNGANKVPCAGILGMEEPTTQTWLIADPVPVTGAVVYSFRQTFGYVVEEDVETPQFPPLETYNQLGFNQLGRQGGSVPTTTPVPEEVVDPEVPNRTAKWLANPMYQPTAVEWESAGEWGVPA